MKDINNPDLADLMALLHLRSRLIDEFLGQVKIQLPKYLGARLLLSQAVEMVETAIKAGDWKVDGACDPSHWLDLAKKELHE